MTTAIENLSAAQTKAYAIRPAVGGFPVLAKVLSEFGVRRNEWTLPAAQSVYLTDLGPVVQLGIPLETGVHEVPPFDEPALLRGLRAEQAGKTTFPEFLLATWRAGVVRYVVDFDARLVTYYGVEGDSYVEEYPDVALAV